MKAEKKRTCKHVVIIFISSLVVIAGICFVTSNNSKKTTIASNVVSERILIPGGQSIGIEMDVKGALIVGTEYNVGPKVGDMIIKVNGENVESAADVIKIVCDTKQRVNLVVKRKNREIKYSIKPKYNSKTKSYKLGLWVKEKIAGIGTLSFYDPKTNKYAALGHGIYETETGTLLESKDGYLLKTKIQEVKEGKKGDPGELSGYFYDCDEPIGTIEKNSIYGIYGKSDTKTMEISLSEPMIMASQEQIKEGEAYILTTLDSDKVEKFKIKILKVNHQNKIDSRGIEFKVIDHVLINKCGGIIQGMSGSPIIQNNRIIGAVTHVLIDEPLKGYGIFAEWMVKEIDN